MLHLLAAPLLLIAQLTTLPAGRDDAHAEPKGGTVAIVDLDAVSKAVGWDAEIVDDRKAAEYSIRSEFAPYAHGIQTAWAARRAEIGKAAHLNGSQMKVINATAINGDDFRKLPLTKDQRDEFLRCSSEASQAVRSAYDRAQEVMHQRDAKVIDSYRQAMKPAVRRVAAAAGVTIVLAPNTVFYYDPTVDLSDRVADELRKAMPQHAMPAMPKMDFPEFRFSGTGGVPEPAPK